MILRSYSVVPVDLKMQRNYMILISINASDMDIQVTFSEKGTKITPLTHIRKFEILHFSDNISKITMT